MVEWFKNHKYVLIVPAYGLFYCISFVILEMNLPESFAIIHTKLDDMIPFNEIFIIFYYLWFAYMAVSFYIIIVGTKETFMKTAFFLMTGMTAFIIISAVFPNGHDLRPVSFARDNIFVSLTKYIYSLDPPRNILPSIHVFNSWGSHLGLVCAVREHEKLSNKKWIPRVSLMVSILITISTLFVKQHSVVDVISAIILSIICYYLFFICRLHESVCCKQ